MQNESLPKSVWARPFDDVLQAELDSIDLRRSNRRNRGAEVAEEPTDAPPPVDDVHRRALDSRLVGLAFSGGGIRSATFNLGILQGLAKLRLLHTFDYLSTVSGGGYIGSWLSAWVSRSSFDDVVDQLDPAGRGATDPAREEEIPRPTASMTGAEPGQIRFLREYSNYLTPKLGWFGADTWTSVAIYLRNFILNLIILVTALCAVLILPHVVAWLLHMNHRSDNDPTLYGTIAALIGALLFSIYAIGHNLGSFSVVRKKGPAQGDANPMTSQESVQKKIVIPLFLASILYACVLWKLGPMTALDYVIIGAVGHSACSLLAYLIAAYHRMGHGFGGDPSAGNPVPWKAILISMPIAGALGGLMHWGIAGLFRNWNEAIIPMDVGMIPGHIDAAAWPVTVWGAPLVVVSFCLVWILHVGFVGRGLPDELREWWSRLTAWLLIYSIVWILFFGIAVYGPIAIISLDGWMHATLTWGWLTTTIGGIIVGKSAATGEGEKKKNSKLELVAKIGPYIFIIGLLMILSFALDAVLLSPETLRHHDRLHNMAFGKIAVEYWGLHVNDLFAQPWRLLFLPALAAVSLLLSWRVDVNQFSMHLYYRNRLSRCYLGASNCTTRDPQPFTGFDPSDDIALCELAPHGHDTGKSRTHNRKEGDYEYDGPYPLINATLNLVGGDDLAWQQRKAASFVFSPNFCGYVTRAGTKRKAAGKRGKNALWDNAFQPTHDYAASSGFVSLGTAMSISGAAASPNMGYHTSPPLAFLLTLFNVRLGWWLGNPRHPVGWNQSSPRLVLLYLLSELFGMTNDEKRYVYLSDGGHFENLGVYELVRRRCRFIVACDAEQDEDFAFPGLSNAIEKCRADLGVDIELDVEQIRKGENGRSTWHCAVGRIRYDLVDPRAPVGTIVYLKASLTGDEPTDVLGYGSANPTFPHQSTADQWFDEMQFESYRALGEHIVEEVFGPCREASAASDDGDVDRDGRMGNGKMNGVANAPEEGVPVGRGPVEIEDLFVKVRQRWYPPSPYARGAFTRHTTALDGIHRRIREDKALRFLDAEIYPEWNVINPPKASAGAAARQMLRLPATEEELRAGFYLCASMIQLMESVYIDLDLEQYHDHPDNRGWMNLFKQWSWSGMFRTVWTVTASTYGARFQTFCARRLSLNVGEVSIMSVEATKEGSRDDIRRDLLDRASVMHGSHILNDVEFDLIRIYLKERDADAIVLFRITPQGFPTWDERGKEVRNDDRYGGGELRSIAFQFGIALLHEDRIVYFRIQNHLRRMGLARRALKKLMIARRGKLGAVMITPEMFPVNRQEQPTEEDCRAFIRLVKSTGYELGYHVVLHRPQIESAPKARAR